MSEFNIFITRAIPQAGIDLLLEKGYKVEVYSGNSAISTNELLKQLQRADALIPLLSDKISKELMKNAPRLKVIANYAVGYNNIDIDYAKRKGIVVTNTPDILTPATADLAWALLMALSKRIVEGDRFVRLGRFKGWEPELLLGADVSGKTVGIIGAGRIGRAFALRAKGFEMDILYVNRTRKFNFEQETGACFVDLETLLSRADFISLHCPLTPETRHLLNADNLRRVKNGAYLINTARGAVIDEQALISALQSGRLAGAGLDVYEFEPHISGELLKMDQVILMPHVGSGTVETRAEMARLCARNIIAVLEGQAAVTPVY